MGKTDNQTHTSSKAGKAINPAAQSEQSSQMAVSKALEVLREGLRTIDDAADLLRGALIDMEEGTRPHSFTGHHLNGIGKFIALKKEKDRALAISQKTKCDPYELPGGKRRLA